MFYEFILSINVFHQCQEVPTFLNDNSLQKHNTKQFFLIDAKKVLDKNRKIGGM